MNKRDLTPLQRERLGAWIDETQACAHLSNAALADRLEQEVCEACDLTGVQLTLLHEALDRLRGLPQGLRAKEGL